jgi:hypothetical protein
MSYGEWFEKHAQKHKKIVDKLVSKGFERDEIIEYFDFDNMVANERDFCPLYEKNKKCHDIKKLNCYLCACPHFRFDDGGIKEIDKKVQYSLCDIDSKNGREGVYADVIHQDCSQCHIPHTTRYIQKHFDLDWREIMSNCDYRG